MKENPAKAALLVIDMENGFLDPRSAHCIKGAADTVPACCRAVVCARKKGIPVFFIKRLYRADGSDVELVRYADWQNGGRAMAPGSEGFNSAEAPEGLRPLPGDYSIIKPRWSAFFHTELDLILRRLGVRTVILTGTTTPNCIRTTAYDADSLDYNVIVLADCCSSQNEFIQYANLTDLNHMGAVILLESDFEQLPTDSFPDFVETIRADMLQHDDAPEPFGEHGWTDRW